MHGDFDFSDISKRQVGPFKIGEDEYVLQEASADTAIRWRNALMKAARVGADGRMMPGDGLADTEALLVKMCLKKHGVNGSAEVDLGFVRGLPSRVLKRLHEEVVKISDMKEDATDPKAQALANLLAREDSPVSYETMRDFIRKTVAGPDGAKFKVLENLLEEPDAAPKD